MTDMLPIGPLMAEHRLILRAVAAMKAEASAMRKSGKADGARLESYVDFIKTYADRCHHGKEEDILFQALGKYRLSPEHRKTLDELAGEHVLGRKMTGMLESSVGRLAQGDAQPLSQVLEHMEALCLFYPAHIETEERRFFIPAMDYLTAAERDGMLSEMRRFDAGLIHERYGRAVEAMERRRQ
jgi:hemerythrin-like domain-containing protein